MAYYDILDRFPNQIATAPGRVKQHNLDTCVQKLAIPTHIVVPQPHIADAKRV